MVGRIVVVNEGAAPAPAVPGSPIPDITEDPFPTVEEIMRTGRVSRG